MGDVHPRLPVDNVLDDLSQVLETSPAAVLQAPPGSGKTTRVPPALLAAPWLNGQRILMLEPRRLAATNAARYMASCLGEPVGRTIGFSIRYARQVSAKTRVEVITEGLLTRRMQADPELSGVGLVIFDEFHERSLHADLALAFCRDIQQGLRSDLRLLVMSATLETAPLARLLGDCPIVTATGRAWPVTIRHLAVDAAAPIAETTARGVGRALAETSGDILAFLPGAAEIRRCQDLLAAQARGAVLHALYGHLPFSEQEAAIRPGSRRKVVLATNLAETSLTIEGIETVVDSGWERRPRFDTASGMMALETVRISQASAAQRAGRAGRLGPGHCYRLWSEGTHGALLPFTPPEILLADLAPLAFELAAWGVGEAEELAWLYPPPAGHLAGARRLLEQLEAIDRAGLLTPVGREMLRYPAHPRLARLLVEAVASGQPGLGSDLAAILGEREMRLPAALPSRPKSLSDLQDRLDLLHQDRSPRTAAVRRASRYWRRRLAAGAASPSETDAVGRLLAVAFPDRLARQRGSGSAHYQLRDGRGARLSERSAVYDAAWLVGVEVARKPGGESLIHQAASLDAALVDQLFGAQAEWQREVAWSEDGERLVGREVRRLGALLLQERPAKIASQETVPRMLELVRRSGLDALPWSAAARQLRARVDLLRECFPEAGWPDWSDRTLLATLESWLAAGLTKARQKADLQRIDLVALFKDQLGWRRLTDLERLAPERLTVPSGSSVRLDYAAGRTPVLAVKLQELFGLAETPRVAGGRMPVLVHLLSPAGRPLAVTQDLRSFWRDVYPEVQKEMKGRYPRHPWPNDPWQAEATRRAKPRNR